MTFRYCMERSRYNLVLFKGSILYSK